jgi:hypothetical protein
MDGTHVVGPEYDETEVVRGMVGTEKVTITRMHEDGRVDRMERQKYPKDKDVRRFVSDETVEDTTKEKRRNITDRPQKKQTTITHKDGTYIHSTDVTDVERTHIHKKEREHFGPRRPEEKFLPETERLDQQRKVSYVVTIHQQVGRCGAFATKVVTTFWFHSWFRSQRSKLKLKIHFRSVKTIHLTMGLLIVVF